MQAKKEKKKPDQAVQPPPAETQPKEKEAKKEAKKETQKDHHPQKENLAESTNSRESKSTFHQKLEAIKMKEFPQPSKIFHKYGSQEVNFQMIKVAHEFGSEKISHSTFCQAIIENYRDYINNFQKAETRSFYEHALKKLDTFSKITAEFVHQSDSISNVFEFIELILVSIDTRYEFAEAKKWTLRKLDQLFTEKFHNSEIILIENVG